MGDSGSYRSMTEETVNFPMIELDTVEQREQAVEQLLRPALDKAYFDEYQTELDNYIISGNPANLDILFEEDGFPEFEDYLDTLNDEMRRARGDVPRPPTPPTPSTSLSEAMPQISGASSVGSTGDSVSDGASGSEVCSGIYCDLIGRERDR